MKRAAWIVSLCLALPFAAGCPADDSEEGDEGTNTNATSNTSGSSETDASGSDPTGADGSSGDDSDDSSAALGCAANIDNDTTDGATEDVQTTWGAPCTDDSDCVALLGEGGVCLVEAVIFELPQGYCSKECTLPSGEMYSFDDPQCDAAGGVDCIGQAPLFQVCSPQCTDDAQCSRDGYTCRNFPLIAQEGDPTYCLMPDCCEGSCAEE